jgi:hypothetical protein
VSGARPAVRARVFARRLGTVGRLALGGGEPAQRRYLRVAFGAVVGRYDGPPVPLAKRLRMLRHGFLPKSHHIYDFASYGYDAYLSDYARRVRTLRLNGEAEGLLDDKLAFAHALGRIGARVPAVLGLMRQATLYPLSSGGEPSPEGLRSTLDRVDALVVKPVYGRAGRDVHVLRRDRSHYLRNGAPATWDEVAHALALQRDYMLVSEFVAQGRFPSQLFPDTTNSLRIVTMRREASDPFVAFAVQRIGTRNSIPVDNWSRGGLSAAVDLEDGTLGPGVTFPSNTTLEWHARHPDVGSPIAGAQVPEWPALVDHVLSLARRLPLRYVGWDLVLMDDGFVVLEGNSSTDVNLLQVHRPLLADPRVRAFYAEHAVL